jgi:FkbM family methyltransferase
VEQHSSGRLTGLDGIRGVAMFAILIVHVILVLPRDNGADISPLLVAYVQMGRHGMTAFFVLSGFLLYLPFAGATLSGGRLPSIGRYARHRVLRIWPAYLVALVVSGLVVGTAVLSCSGPVGCADNEAGRLTDPWLLITNLALIQGWFPSTAFTGLGVSWSLVTEVAFYAALPLLGWWGVRLARRRPPLVAALAPALLMIGVGFATRWTTQIGWVASGHSDDVGFGANWFSVLNHSVFAQADLMGGGMLCAVVVLSARGRGSEVLARMRRWAWLGIAIGALAPVVLLTVGLPSGEAATEFVGIGVAGLIAMSQLAPGRRGRMIVGLLEWRPLRALGEYSYSWFVWHFPVLLWLRDHAPGLRYGSLAEVPVRVLEVGVIVGLIGFVSHRLIERPAMGWARRTDTAAIPGAVRRRMSWAIRDRFPDRRVVRDVQGVSLAMPWAHRLPDYAIARPDYGQNLVRLAAALAESGPFTMLDVGANIGDSTMQVLHAAGGQALAVEADPAYLSFLRENTDDRVTIVEALLATEASEAQVTAVRSGGTTRFAGGVDSDARPPVTAAQLREDHPGFDRLRLVKSDTDGWDVVLVPVIAEAWSDAPPVLFFEYDHRLSRAAGNDPLAVWRRLAELGYRTVGVWENAGAAVGRTDVDSVAALAGVLDDPERGWAHQYWDVVVVHESDPDAERVVADLIPNLMP